MTKDPVCGMAVNEEGARETAQHKGETYYFCSADCKRTFQQHPEKYVPQQPQRAQGHHA